MKNATLFLALSLFIYACQSDAKKDNADTSASAKLVDVQLACEDMGTTDEAPHFAVYAIINEQKTKLMEVSSGCQIIEKTQYTDYQIPNDAIIAVGGWWAGAGDYFYALQKGEQVKIFYAVADEAQETPGFRYKELATYAKGKFNVKQ